METEMKNVQRCCSLSCRAGHKKCQSELPTQKQAVGSGWGLGVSLINVHIQYTCSPVGFLDFTVWAGRILMHIQ